MNETEEPSALERRALRARRDIIAMSGRGGCFLGAALSSVDVLVYLYSELLRVTPASAEDPDRDIFLLSKGHAVPALYAVLAERGRGLAERAARTRALIAERLGVDAHLRPARRPTIAVERLPCAEEAAHALVDRLGRA